MTLMSYISHSMCIRMGNSTLEGMKATGTTAVLVLAMGGMDHTPDIRYLHSIAYDIL